MFLEDKVKQLNERLVSVKNSHIVIWGTGIHSDNLLKYTSILENSNICFIDREVTAKTYYGKPVYSINDDILNQADYIIISSYTYKDEIYDQIDKMGFGSKVFHIYNSDDKGDFYRLPSYKNDGFYYVGGFTSWDDAQNNSVGYDDISIALKVFESTERVINGNASYERDSVCFYETSYNYRLLFLLHLIDNIKTSNQIKVLDFGGGIR